VEGHVACEDGWIVARKRVVLGVHPRYSKDNDTGEPVARVFVSWVVVVKENGR
jgi:hypothetical protein